MSINEDKWVQGIVGRIDIWKEIGWNNFERNRFSKSFQRTGYLASMRVWRKVKPTIENCWNIKINRFTYKKEIFNKDFVM